LVGAAALGVGVGVGVGVAMIGIALLGVGASVVRLLDESLMSPVSGSAVILPMIDEARDTRWRMSSRSG
jgi:hypothetical protein